MKRIATLLSTALLATGMLVGCGAKQEKTTETSSKTISASSQGETTKEEKAEIRTDEIDFKNGEKNIYGMMYLPAKEQDKYPIVIMSHGFGGMYSDNEIYAKKLAEDGYACYAFDFCGGGRGSKSDGDMTEMSVLTEKSDLLAVMDGIEALDYVDTDNLFLFGQSQGGFVSTLAGVDRLDEVKAMVLLYPAYSLQDDCWERHGSIDNVPETESVMNNTLGAIYSLDAMSFDVYDVMGAFTKPVLILHGDQDDVVDISYSERAVKTFPNAELEVLNGTGHGFSARQKDAAKIITPWIEAHTGSVIATDETAG